MLSFFMFFQKHWITNICIIFFFIQGILEIAHSLVYYKASPGINMLIFFENIVMTIRRMHISNFRKSHDIHFSVFLFRKPIDSIGLKHFLM